jgi:ribosomal protein S18 acetylase RimI-like enzyme
VIRAFRPDDRSSVRNVCAQTGFLGNPQEPWFEGREEFADLFSAYYTDFEPENALVVEVEGEVEGYLLGCLDSYRQKRVFATRIRPRLAMRLLRPAWWTRSTNRSFALAMARSALRGETRIPERRIFRDYPAHLHTNIADPGLRGQGIGRAMMIAFLDRLHRLGVPGVHLGTTSHNRQALRYYRGLGFDVLVKRRLTCYDHVIEDPPLYLMVLGQRLGPDRSPVSPLA